MPANLLFGERKKEALKTVAYQEKRFFDREKNTFFL